MSFDWLAKAMPPGPPPYRRILSGILKWTALSFILNLGWEVMQLPLYTIASAQSMAQITYVVAHCTAGDAMIAAISFVIACLLLRDVDWPLADPWRGTAIVTLLGVAYTGYSEWRNVYQAGNWGYSASMPLVFGIGIAPLLQWMFIPVAAVLILRAQRTPSKIPTPER